jgi:glycosyltransferase involved in cell wall biosynthesis
MGEYSEPFISVVMPNYNGARYLRRAIDSFLAEDYDRKELIIVDGKSTDESHEIISEYSQRYPDLISWLAIPDSGISDAVNSALPVCHGNIIGYLGSDDLLAGGTFKIIARWAPYVDFDAIFFNSYTYYVRERNCVLQRPATLQIDTESLLRRGTIVGLQNIYYRKRVFKDVRFNIENKYSMDYELLLEVASKNAMFFYVDHVATLNYFDGNISHNNEKQTLEAAHVARRFCGDYDGPLFGEDLLPEELRRNYKEPNKQDLDTSTTVDIDTQNIQGISIQNSDSPGERITDKYEGIEEMMPSENRLSTLQSNFMTLIRKIKKNGK